MYMGLDDTNVIAKVIPTIIEQTIADYQAKFGTFLTLKSKLMNLKSRLTRVSAKPDYQAAAVTLQTQVENLLFVQDTTEKMGMSFITAVYQIQADPVVRNVIVGKFPDLVDAAGWAKVMSSYEFLLGAKDMLAGLLADVNKQVADVANMENAVIALEKQAGISPFMGVDLSSIPSWVYPAVLITLTIATKGFGLYAAAKKYKRQ